MLGTSFNDNVRLPNDALQVSDGILPPEMVGLIEPVSPDTPMDEILRRYRQHGFVLIKGLLPKEDVHLVRQRYFEAIEPTGCLAPGTRPVKGVFNTMWNKQESAAAGSMPASQDPAGNSKTDTAIKLDDVTMQAHYQDWYVDGICNHPTLTAFIAKFTGWGSNTHALRRTLLRLNMPQGKPTGVHYDHIYLRHGEDTVLTAWVPIGDISFNGGGLMYLEDSCQVGQEFEKQFTDRAKADGFSDDEAKNAYNQNMSTGGLLSNSPLQFAKEYKKRWLLSNYEAGDVVLHNCYAIHASCINNDKENIIRLATDLRFVNSSRPWDTRWNDYLQAADGL